MFSNRNKKILFIWAALFVAIAIGTVIFGYRATRPAQSTASADRGATATASPASAEGQPITANNGQGTTANYQVQEGAATAQTARCQKQAPEVVYYTASPTSVNLGDKVALSWYVRGAKIIKVSGQTYTSEKGSIEVMPRQFTMTAQGRRTVTPFVDYPLAAYVDEGCAPVEFNVRVSFKDKGER